MVLKSKLDMHWMFVFNSSITFWLHGTSPYFTVKTVANLMWTALNYDYLHKNHDGKNADAAGEVISAIAICLF